MSTVITWQTTSVSAEDTEKIGERIGSSLRGGEVIELVSDLGGGKTTFVRGLARGFGSSDRVASPTFTISRVYTSGERRMHHFDFYRLHEPGIISEELAELLHEPDDVIVIEWAGIVAHVLPKKRLEIHIEHMVNGRRFTFRCPEALEYLMKAIK